ncbi:hypothetical protein UUU_35930 [Klebsiella pneumoniae subsp. pneumoniae DSM 30104 = JCM 1662 = NBRC 14940]|nr:hypothetical protein UUU_35930 [Klebsiella pneumoniae subsp. pneumoniae DSM 30104 = JCM 1662 = NBRC 14940]
MAQQCGNADILDNLLQRHLQLFLIFVFIVAQLGNITQIVNRFPGFILHFIQLRLANAKTKQEVVDPTGEGVGTVKDAHRIAFRQIQLKEETVVIQ